MKNVFDVLKERGLVEQCTHEEEIREILGKEPVTFYVGFDPTADSLHIGHYITVIIMMHLQRAGHRPIALFGGGTGMIGDPTGKSDMRKMLTVENIDYNISCFRKQFERFLDFSDDKTIMVNNGDWLRDLNYIDFLREVGVHFSVNRMLTAECFKTRMERGLTFLEFNYMLMQSYDFDVLYKKYGCKMQVGGNDQWSNMIGGIELIRRKEQGEAYAFTIPLLTNSEGKKMGKTEKGALWLDANKTSPFEFYQYFRNVADVDVERFLKLLTFLPLEQISKLCEYQDERINEAKRVLAFEITKQVHGEEEAKKAEEASKALFANGVDLENVPKIEIEKEKIEEGISLPDILILAKLATSKSDARRSIEQGGISVNGEQIKDVNFIIKDNQIVDGYVMLKKGKKAFCKIVCK